MWNPVDQEKFNKYYLSGMTDSELASNFNTSVDRVKVYLSKERDENRLPFRGDFDADKHLAEIITEDSEHLELKLLKKIRNSKVAINISELADEFDVSPKKIKDAIVKLNAEDYLVKHDGESAYLSAAESGRQTKHCFNYQNGNKFKFGVISDTHMCFPPQTPISTIEGDRIISRIKVGDKVLTHKGRYCNVTEIITNKASIYTKFWFRGANNGGKNAIASLTCTPNHPIMLCRDNIDIWVPAEGIQVGDYIRVKGKKCKYCDKLTAPWLDVCKDHDPYKRPRAYSNREQKKTKLISSKGLPHFNRDIKPEMDKWEKEGYRVIPTDRVRPDFLAVKNGQITAVEVEAPVLGYPQPFIEKYSITGMDKYYDDVVWIEKTKKTRERNRTYEYLDANCAGFIGCIVSKIDTINHNNPRKTYNLKVEEDESYVAKNCVVHNCSKYCNYGVLNSIYDIFESEGVENVYLPGNYIDGEARFNVSDLHVHGFENQVNFFVKHFPKREGVTTHYIDGDDHEGWYQKNYGINVGQRVEDTAKRYGRKDLKYLGYMEADVIVPAKNGSTKIRIQHPGGGSSYAISYAAQKIIESLSGGAKPNILIIGHFHKIGYFFIRNVHTILAGCTENQTPFMRKKRLAAHLGGWIIEVTQGDDGSVIGFNQTLLAFYDTKDEEPWEYKGELDEWLPIIQSDYNLGDK